MTGICDRRRVASITAYDRRILPHTDVVYYHIRVSYITTYGYRILSHTGIVYYRIRPAYILLPFERLLRKRIGKA